MQQQRRPSECDLLVFGEITEDWIAEVDTLPLADSAAARVRTMEGPSLGGRAINVATYATLFGLDAHVLSACHESYVEKYLSSELTAHANMGGIFHSIDTAQAWIFRDSTRRSQMTFFKPGSAIVRSKDHDPGSVAQADYDKHISETKSSYFPRYLYCTSELHAFVDELMKYYSDSVVRVFSPGPEVQLVSDVRLDRILSLTSILFLNYSEMRQVEQKMQLSIPQIIGKYKNLSVAIVTMGPGGAILLQRSRRSEIPDIRWVPAVNGRGRIDETGAGDAVAGGFLGHLIRSHQRRPPTTALYIQALKYGMVLASFVIEQYGTLVPALSLETVNERLAEYESDGLGR